MNRTNRFAVGIQKALGALGLMLAIGTAGGGCVIAARGQLRTGVVVADQAPPPDQVETYDARPGYVWIKGRWDWQNGGWQWVQGHWERERAGYGYQHGSWQQANGRWHWTEGQWVQAGQGSGGVYVDDRPQVIDHRDGQQGTVIVTPGGPGPYVPPGGLTASNGAGTVITSPGGVIIVGPNQPPPPVRVESPGAARGGYIWVRGNWQWSNGQYEWVAGHWEREKAGYAWYDGQWQSQNNQWVWIAGEWRLATPPAPQGPTIQVRDRRTH